MDGRTNGTDWYGTVRGTDFWYEILFGSVRGTDFGTVFLVRYAVRIFCTNKSSRPKSVQRTVKNKILYQKSVPRTVPY